MYVACPVLPCVQAPGGFVAATERPFLVVQALHFSRPAKGFHPLDPQPVRRAAEVSQLPRWAALVDIKHPLSAVALREGGCTRREPIFLSAHSCWYVARGCLTVDLRSGQQSASRNYRELPWFAHLQTTQKSYKSYRSYKSYLVKFTVTTPRANHVTVTNVHGSTTADCLR